MKVSGLELNMIVYTFNLPGLRGQPGLYNEFQASQDYIVKETLSEREREREGVGIDR